MSSSKARRALMRESRALASAGLTGHAAPAAAQGAASSTPSVGGYGLMLGNGHQGADTSRLRGYVYFPELDTKREITSYSRTEILRRARFLYANYGLARRMINGLARMIAGTGLTYQAATDDLEWNRLAEQAYARATRSRFAFDLGQRYNGGSSQQAALRFRFRDGDCAQVLSRDPGTGAARFAFYESHQISSTSLYATIPQTPGWRDGVLHGPHNEALAYRILGDAGAYADVPAGSVLFQCDYERAGQSRGLSALSHAIPNMLDSAEITGYIKAGVKLSNRHGYWIETAAGQQTSQTAGGRAGGAPTVKVTTPEGPIEVEQIYGAGELPSLGAGQTIKFNSAANPHPNQLQLLEFLIREVSWGLPFGGVSPDLLWNIAALGGANTRFVLADAQGFIDAGQQALVDDKEQAEMEFVLACEMAAGRLRPCGDPEWWKALWIPPPRITVDFGRDGKLYLEQVKAGALTFRRVHGWQGNDFETEQRQWLKEYFSWAKIAKEQFQASDTDVADIRAIIYGRPGMGQTAAQLADPSAAEAGVESSADVSAQLSSLLKKPGAAEALLEQLRNYRD
jgi:capsid protein